MTKAGNWVPLDKAFKAEFKYINRPFSKIEAMFSHQCAIKGYAKQWSWSRNKVRKFLEEIRTPKGHLVDTKRTHTGHPVHLIDKGLWGNEDTQGTLKGHHKDTPPTPTYNPNPNPKPKKKKNTVVFNDLEVGKVFTYWQETMNHPRARLDGKREKKIKDLLKIGYTVEDLKTAIDGCKASPFHQGQNDRKTVFDDIELICRDASHVDRFIKTASISGNPTALSEYGQRAVAAAQSWLENKNAR
jgi:hypothetical protein